MFGESHIGDRLLCYADLRWSTVPLDIFSCLAVLLGLVSYVRRSFYVAGVGEIALEMSLSESRGGDPQLVGTPIEA
jgi:hypothetical protein